MEARNDRGYARVDGDLRMTATRLGRFLFATAVAAGVAHLISATIAAVALAYLFPHRIFNARDWPGDWDERSHVVGSFFIERTRDAGSPVVAFAGSSVSYGYPWRDEFIFSRRFADERPDLDVINASIIATDVTGLRDYVVCAAERNDIKLAAVVIEIPVVNTTSHLVRSRKNGQTVAANDRCRPAARDAGYLQLALTRPRGIGWFGFFANTDAREREELPIQIRPVPENYFASALDFGAIREEYVRRMKTLLAGAQQIAGTVYAFPSPIFIPGVTEAGADAAAVRQQLETTVAACESMPGIHCLETSSVWEDRSLYLNVTHLNQAGHAALGHRLASQITVPTQHTRR